MAKKSPKKNNKKKTSNKKTSNQQPKTSTKKVVKKQVVEPSPRKEPKIAPDFFEKILRGKAVFGLLGLLTILLLVTWGSFLFGSNTFLFKDIASDTINVFYPQLYHIAEYFSTEGLPKWSFNQGMGQNVYPLSINDPFNWLLFLIGKDNIATGLVWVEFIKILTAGMLFYGFLKQLKMGYLTAILGAVLYSFSGFMMIGAGWYVFSTEGVHLALILWGFERLFRLNSWWMFSLAVFLIAFYMPVNLYIIAVFMLVYSSLRIYEEKGVEWKSFLSTYLQMILWGALGFLMSMGMSIAVVDQILNSPRVGGESSFFASLMEKGVGLTESREGLTIIGRLFANDFFFNASYDPTSGQLNYKGWNNYLEAPALYCGLSTLLLLPQAFLYLEKRARIAAIVGFGLLLLPLFVPFFRNALWLFAGDYYRIYSLYVAVGFMLLGLKALDFIYQKGKVNLWLLAISFIFWMFLMFAPFLSAKGVEVDGSLRNILVFFMIAAAGAIGAMQWPQYRKSARIALLVIVSLEALYMGSNTYSSERSVIAKKELKEKVGYNDYTVEVVNKLKQNDQGFYRIEKMNYHSGAAIHASTNDAKVQGYYGSKSYHSFNQKNYIRFLDKLDVIDASDENQTRWAAGIGTRPLLQLISSTKYVLYKGNAQKFWYTDLDSIGDIKVLQNPNFLPLGFTYDKVLLESEFDQLSKLNQSVKKQMALLKAMVVADADLDKFSSLSKVDSNLITPNNYPLTALAADINALRAESLQLESWSQNHFKGSIKVSKPKALFLSIPYEQNWSVIVDGQKVNTYRANLGFMAVHLSEGKHSVELSYSPPYFTISWVLSGLGFLLFAGLLWWRSRARKQVEGASLGEGEFAG